MKSMHYNGVKITASGGEGGGGWWLFVLIATVVFATAGTVVIRGAQSIEGVADTVFEWLMIVAGLGVAAMGTAAIAWGITDAIRSRAAVRRFDARHPGLRAQLAAERNRPVEAADHPAVEPARLHVTADRLDQPERVELG